MSTTINHGQLAKVDENGNIDIFYPKTFSKDVYVNDEKTTLETFLGTTSISTIGDGTISGAISAINDQYDQINSKVNWRTGGSAVATFIRSGDDTTTNFAHVSGGKDGGAPFLSTEVVTNGSVTDGITVLKDLQGLKVSGLVNGVTETINLSALAATNAWFADNPGLDPGPLFAWMKANCPYTGTAVTGRCWYIGNATYSLYVYPDRVAAVFYAVSPCGYYMYGYNAADGTGDHVYQYGMSGLNDTTTSLANAWTSINSLSSGKSNVGHTHRFNLMTLLYQRPDATQMMQGENLILNSSVTNYNCILFEFIYNDTIMSSKYVEPVIGDRVYDCCTYAGLLNGHQCSMYMLFNPNNYAVVTAETVSVTGQSAKCYVWRIYGILSSQTIS